MSIRPLHDRVIVKRKEVDQLVAKSSLSVRAASWKTGPCSRWTLKLVTS